jgi:hypothetical protein
LTKHIAQPGLQLEAGAERERRAGERVDAVRAAPGGLAQEAPGGAPVDAPDDLAGEPPERQRVAADAPGEPRLRRRAGQQLRHGDAVEDRLRLDRPRQAGQVGQVGEHVAEPHALLAGGAS